MRLINADKVKAESREHCKTCVLNGTKQCKTCVINLICDRLDLQPTIEERTEGKWIYHRAQGEFLPYMECDNCHEEFLLNMLRPAEFRKVNRFCSNCGADMRGNK